MPLIEAARRTIRHYWRSMLALAAASALCALVLSGALGAGDSIRANLLDSLSERLGPIDWLMYQGERAFQADLETRLAAVLPGIRTSSAIWLAGTVSAGAYRLAAAQVLGIGSGSGQGSLYGESPLPGEAWISRRTADRLAVKAGDELLFQVAKPGFLPSEAPMGGLAPELVALRLKVARISDGFPLQFSPRSDQREALVVLLDRDWLASRIGWTGRANLLAAASPLAGSKLDTPDVGLALDRSWSLADAGYHLEALPASGRQELLSDRVFIEDGLAAAVEKLVPAVQRKGVYTWFADRITREPSNQEQANYVFVGSGDTPFMSRQPARGEIVLTDWLARRIGAGVGQKITLTFRLPDAEGALQEHGASFRVSAIIAVPDSAEARDLMPRFPGMVDADSCRDWDPGLTLDLSRLDSRDEAYWERYRGTPQAYLNLDEARQLFAHPYGTLNAIRLSGIDPQTLSTGLARAFPPSASGFQLVGAREDGVKAVLNGVDFGSLFLGLNALLMLAGLLLALQTLGLALQRRRAEFRLYQSCGWSSARIRQLVLLETLIVMVPAALAGALLGLSYDALTIQGLNTFWKGVTNLELSPRFSLMALAEAVLLTVAGTTLVAILAIRRLDRAKLKPAAPARPAWVWMGMAGFSLAVAIVLAIWGKAIPGFGVVEAFFSAGFLVVAAAACGLRGLLGLRAFALARPGATNLGLRNLHYRRRRILASAGSLALGIYLILGIGGYLPESGDPADPRSATGGFPLLLHSTLPLSREDLGAIAAWKPLGIRVHDGDDASCLNIRRSANPPLYGVDPAALRGHFSLAESGADPWSILEQTPADGAIPVVVDSTVLIWGLGKAIGDRLDYRAEDGRVVRLLIAGALADSIFQGGLILSETHFRELFPGESGYRLSLLGNDAGSDQRTILERRLRNRGLWLEGSGERLARLQGVERGYLAIFLVLGSLALALASLGFAVQIFRSAQEDAAQIRLLHQLGWPWPRIRRQIWSGHVLAWGWGALWGITAAWLALQGQAKSIDWPRWWLLCALIVVAGTLALLIASLRLRLLPAENEL